MVTSLRRRLCWATTERVYRVAVRPVVERRGKIRVGRAVSKFGSAARDGKGMSEIVGSLNSAFTLAFVVTSMFGLGLGLTLKDLLALLKNVR